MKREAWAPGNPEEVQLWLYWRNLGLHQAVATFWPGSSRDTLLDNSADSQSSTDQTTCQSSPNFTGHVRFYG